MTRLKLANTPSTGKTATSIQRHEQLERRGQDAALAAFPETRRAMLDVLKTQGTADTDQLAVAVGITISGARQHLTALERDGLVAHSVERSGPGRPRHNWTLTSSGDALYPRHYGALTNELLEYVEDEDPDLLARIFERRGNRRLANAQTRTGGQTFAEKVATVASILDRDGYLADFRADEDGSYVITEHNCAVLAVAMRYGHACSSELAFLEQAIPEAEITRIAHRINGAHVCAYRVVLRDNAVGA